MPGWQAWCGARKGARCQSTQGTGALCHSSQQLVPLGHPMCQLCVCSIVLHDQQQNLQCGWNFKYTSPDEMGQPLAPMVRPRLAGASWRVRVRARIQLIGSPPRIGSAQSYNLRRRRRAHCCTGEQHSPRSKHEAQAR